ETEWHAGGKGAATLVDYVLRRGGELAEPLLTREVPGHESVHGLRGPGVLVPRVAECPASLQRGACSVMCAPASSAATGRAAGPVRAVPATDHPGSPRPGVRA